MNQSVQSIIGNKSEMLELHPAKKRQEDEKPVSRDMTKQFQQQHLMQAVKYGQELVYP